MKNPSFRPAWKGVLWLGLSACGVMSCIPSSAQNTPFPSSNWNRVLIVSGGPNPQYNQYAIESNARYVASLTSKAKWRRILFADGKPTSKTISTVVENDTTHARDIISWIWDINAPNDVTEFKAPSLAPINDSSTPDSITQNLAAFSATNNATDAQLVYVTGHGSPGVTNGRPDYVNTVYSAWGDNYSARQLARSIQASKSAAPLVLVMVQCYGGGFANAMFQDGDPKNPIWNHDFCGFFAAIPERMAAGCTSQVNERNYQDFTTHFFAALSGVSRDGRRVSGADYDRNGHVSLYEAYAYAQINDDSIDVPLSTSDAYLRDVLGAEKDASWLKTSYSRLTKDANPAQLAVLDGLSAKLGLTGEDRLTTVQDRYGATQSKARISEKASDWVIPPGINKTEFNASYDRLQKLLNARFPDFAQLRGAAKASAVNDATALVAARSADLNIVYRAYTQSDSNDDNSEVEEARLLRFLRAARSIILTKRLEQDGAPESKAILARLRTSENRSEF